jgi:hypothetical protein
MLSVAKKPFMLSVLALNLGCHLLFFYVLNVIMLNVIMLNVVMLSVAEPQIWSLGDRLCFSTFNQQIIKNGYNSKSIKARDYRC